MAAVQFFGVKSVVDAFQLTKDAQGWAVFSGKDPITTGSDAAELEHFLNMLQPGGTAAEYALRIYKGLEDGEEIDRDTPYSTAFRFKLNEPMAMSGFSARPGMDPITAEIHGFISKKVSAAIKKELEPDEDDDDDGDGSIGGYVNMFLKNVAKDPQQLPGIIRGIREAITGKSVGMPVSVAGVPPTKEQAATRAGSSNRVGSSVSPQEKMNRIAAAFDRLEKCDPNFLVNVEKLADLAETNPAMYNMAVKMLG